MPCHVPRACAPGRSPRLLSTAERGQQASRSFHQETGSSQGSQSMSSSQASQAGLPIAAAAAGGEVGTRSRPAEASAFQEALLSSRSLGLPAASASSSMEREATSRERPVVPAGQRTKGRNAADYGKLQVRQLHVVNLGRGKAQGEGKTLPAASWPRNSGNASPLPWQRAESFWTFRSLPGYVLRLPPCIPRTRSAKRRKGLTGHHAVLASLALHSAAGTLLHSAALLP